MLGSNGAGIVADTWKNARSEGGRSRQLHERKLDLGKLNHLIKGARDTLGCLVSVLALPVAIIALLIGYLKISDTYFPEDPNIRATKCINQKDNYRRSMMCGSVYDIGESFLKDPTSTYYCSDSAVIQKIRVKSSLYNFILDACSRDDADSFSANIDKDLIARRATFSECGLGHDGRALHPQVQQKYDAFLACRSYRNPYTPK